MIFYSSGSMSVSIHITSPLSQGLFKRGIAQSGSSLLFPTEKYIKKQLDELPDLSKIYGKNILFVSIICVMHFFLELF